MASETHPGTKIKLRRQALGLRQDELAARVGVHVSSVTAWEGGKHRPERHLGRLEAVLGISLRDGTGQAETFDDPAEAALWALTRYSQDERRTMIEQYRRDRDQHDQEAAGL